MSDRKNVPYIVCQGLSVANAFSNHLIRIYSKDTVLVQINLILIFSEHLSRGLISSHILAELLQSRKLGMSWYHGELLNMALDVGYRLLPAFNSTTGLPHPRY